MKRFLLNWAGVFMIATMICLSGTASAQEQQGIGFQRYFERNEFLMASPGAMTFGLYGYDNPALLQYLHEPDVLFSWTSDNILGDINRWGLFTAAPNFSFSFINNDFADNRFREYRVAFGGGSDKLSTGFSVNWYGGNTRFADLKTNVTAGLLYRPSAYISAGLMSTTTYDVAYQELILDLAIRPFGTPALALYGDYAIDDINPGITDGRWSAGAAVEILPGLRFTSRYIHDMGITAGVQFSFGRTGMSYQSHMDTKGNQSYHSYGIRMGALDRNIMDHYFRKNKNYVELSARGSLPYQTYRFFDNRTTFMSVLVSVEQAKNDPSVSGIVVNTTNMGLNGVKAWELKERLDLFREAGKRVVLYIEEGGMSTLHLASAADFVVVDPMGSLTVPGYLIGKTYLAELLESVGIGVQEMRQASYKSAADMVTRTDMSDEDKEQLGRIVESWYDLLKKDVMASKEMDDEAFEELINKGITLSAKELMEAGIADTLARPSEIQGIISKLEGRQKRRVSSGSLYTVSKPRDDQWGPEKIVQVLYAEGVTMTETGIRARLLSNAIRQAAGNPSVEAIVLRVDSPGGQALASDLVAEEIRKATEKKPVIVSMGALAASGGYWISMHADTIVAAPNSITGSIGVLYAFMYDDGLNNKLRIHSDYVSKGNSADLMFGPTLPLIGLTLPGRPLDEFEMERAYAYITDMYDDFIEKVADGRGMEPEAVREIAAGRVWTGADAKEIGLVDELGSLYTAIQIAKEAAGITKNDKVVIKEGPAAQTFSLSMLLGQVFTSQELPVAKQDPVKDYLEMMLEHNARPLMILPFEDFSWMHNIQEK